MARRVVVAWVVAVFTASTATAQSSGSSGTSTGQNPPQTPTLSSSTSTAEDLRPATTTFYGDTGLWFVPTAEVLPASKWSVTGYRRGTNFIQGFANVGDFAGTFALGISGRAEIFGSLVADTRIARETQPVFFPDPASGGIIDRYPLTSAGWSGNHLGDFYMGAKVNLLSESRQAPLALAVRGMVKLPTGAKSAPRYRPSIGIA